MDVVYAPVSYPTPALRVEVPEVFGLVVVVAVDEAATVDVVDAAALDGGTGDVLRDSPSTTSLIPFNISSNSASGLFARIL